MRKLVVVLVLVGVMTTLGSNLWAQSGGYVAIYADYPGFQDCFFYDTTPGTLEMYVVHTLLPEAASVRFAAPMPACMAGATFLYDQSDYTLVGSSQTGVTVDYVTCVPLPVVAVKMVFATSGTSQWCCPIRVLPHPGDVSGRVEVVDCSGITLHATQGNAVINGDFMDCPCPYNELPEIVDPSPQDGATGVSNTTLLDWVTIDLDEDDVDFYSVHLDTVSDPGEIDIYIGPPYDPGPLLPNQTYYWKVKAHEFKDYPFPPCEWWIFEVSPEWTFTHGPVKTQVRTWGAIKALYGNLRF